MKNSFLTTTLKEVFDVIYTHEEGQIQLTIPKKPYTKEALKLVLLDWWNVINSNRPLTPKSVETPFTPNKPPTLMKISLNIITDDEVFLERYGGEHVLQFYFD